MVRYGISGGLSPEQLKQMHEAALSVLEDVGVQASNPKILERLSGQPGVRIEGNRVYLRAEVVDPFIKEHVNKHRADAELPPPQEFTIQILSGYAFQSLDAETGELRPMSTPGCIEAAKLVDCLREHGVFGGTPGIPQDVPPALREILAFKIGCEYSRTAGGVGMTSMKSAEYISRMSEASGVSIGGMSAFVLSPLRVEGEALDMALTFMDKGAEIGICIQAMPLQGVTTPILMPAAFVENIATVVGTFAIFRLAGIERDIDLHFDLYPFDLKLGTIAYGTPEHVLAYLMGAQINRYYGGRETYCKAFHTNALFPDAHSIAQRAAFGAVAVLNGARDFHYGGMLGIDKIFSAEQLIIDMEIVSYLRAISQEIDFSREAMGLEMIKEVGPAGQFITHASTLQRCRDIWNSDLFENTSPEQWQASDRRRLKDKVHGRIRELMAGYDFSLERDVKKQLDDIYTAAAKELS